MDRRIDAHAARTQFCQIMDFATGNGERFIVDRRGEPAVVIMSVSGFIRTAAPPPDWLASGWTSSRERGLESLGLDEINAQIEAHRQEKDSAARAPE